MNNVYVLEQGCKYEGGGVVAVYGDYDAARGDLMALVRREDKDTDEMISLNERDGFPDMSDYYTYMAEGSPDFFTNHSNYVCISTRKVYYNRRIDG